MLHLNDLFTHDIIFIFLQKIINLIHHTRCGIFNGQYCKIGAAVVYGAHGVTKAVHVEALYFLAKRKQISMQNNAFAARRVAEDQDPTQAAVAGARNRY